MATAAETTDFQKGDCYKYQWARYVARKTLEDDLDALKHLISKSQGAENAKVLVPEFSENASIVDLFNATKPLTGGGTVPPTLESFKVGIIGAGVAGLFTALLFDWLNQHPKLVGQLKVDYDIFEAADPASTGGAGRQGVGGRLYTHSFSDAKRDYYDVGAMRFPDNDVMDRTFRLFALLGLKRNEIGGLLPYYLKDVNNVCPSYFNDVQKVGNVYAKGLPPDPYQLNMNLPPNEQIPPNLIATSPDDLSTNALAPVLAWVPKLFDKLRGVASPQDEQQVWKTLMLMDRMTVRQFFASTDNGVDLPAGPGYNFNTIEWIECATFGTGWYDQSLAECVLEELDFKVDDNKGFWCVDGGAQVIATKMAGLLQNPAGLNMSSQVVSIEANANERKDPTKYVPITLKVKQNGVTTPHDYFAVFNSTTLGALQRMNLQKAGLHWGTNQAIRALGYGASCKVAIYFKEPWWQLPPYNINQGGVARTDLPLRVCVYPSYNNKGSLNPDWSDKSPSVLLCSYTWGQDAQRIGSLITDTSPVGEEQLKNVLLHELALLHTKTPEEYDLLLATLQGVDGVPGLYTTHHAWDWYKDENMSGAFAYFGPSQFSNMWQEILKPQAFGQLFLVGEAASAHHAWIVGALESVVRAAYLLFQSLALAHPDPAGPYQTAMDLLRDDNPDGLPFSPIPLEMPDSAKGPPPPPPGEGDGKEGDGEEGGKVWTYAELVAALSQVESLFDSDLLDEFKKD